MGLFTSQEPEFLAEPPGVQHPFSVGHLHPEFGVVAVRLGGRLEAPNGDAPRARDRVIGWHVVF